MKRNDRFSENQPFRRIISIYTLNGLMKGAIMRCVDTACDVDALYQTKPLYRLTVNFDAGLPKETFFHLFRAAQNLKCEPSSSTIYEGQRCDGPTENRRNSDVFSGGPQRGGRDGAGYRH